MSNTLRIKRRASSGSTGAPTSLANAELAFNEADDTLYYGKGTGGSGGSATTVEAIGGTGSFVSRSGAQSVAGVKTFSDSPVVPTVTASDSSQKAASTAFVKNQSYLTGNQNITLSGVVTGSGATSITTAFNTSGVALPNNSTATNQATSDDSTKLATTAFVQDRIAEVIDSAPAALDTLNELAAAINDDASFSSTVTTSLGEKLVKASNLSDLTNAATARTNLGLGTMATQNASGLSNVTIDCGTF